MLGCGGVSRPVGAIPPNRPRIAPITQMPCYTLRQLQVISKLTPGWQKTSVLESVFDQLSDALVLYDPEFRITGVNRSRRNCVGHDLGRCSNTARKSSSALCANRDAGPVGSDQTPAAPNCTVRLHTGNGMERLVVMRTHQMFDGRRPAHRRGGHHQDITRRLRRRKREVIAESGHAEVLNFRASGGGQ